MRNGLHTSNRNSRRANGEINPFLLAFLIALFLTPALGSLMQYFHMMPALQTSPMGTDMGEPSESAITPKRQDFYMPEASINEKPARKPAFSSNINEDSKEIQADFPQGSN